MTISFNSGYLEITDGSRKTTCPYPIKEIILDGDNVIFTGQDNQPRILLYSDVSGYATAQDLYDDIQTNSVSSGGAAAGYLVYRALLTQSGTNAPTAVVLENTLGGAVVWTYSDVGVYIGTATGLLPNDKTFVMIGDFVNTTINGDNNSFTIDTYDISSIPTHDNGVLQSTAIEILVYP